MLQRIKYFVPNMKSSAMILAAASITLSACGDKGAEAPTGQVIATYDGIEITASELRQEMANMPGGLSPKQAQQGALQAVLSRTILADAARKEKMDQTPAAAIMKKRAEDLALVDMYTRKLRENAPLPSDEEVRQYVSEHPASFSQRRIFVVDQLIAESTDPELLKAMEPLDTLKDIENLLHERNIGFRRTVGTLDALTVDADVAEKIAGLPAGTVFASPSNGTIRANKIRSTVIEPVDDDAAQRVAKSILQSRRVNEIVRNQISQLLQNGLKNVKYNKDYEPKKENTESGDANNSTAAETEEK